MMTAEPAMKKTPSTSDTSTPRIPRRSFLRAAAGGGLAVATLPTLVDSFAVQALAGGDPRLHQLLEEQDRVLVLVQMAGGNDGLNTVIPHSDPLYYERRPTIAIAKNKTLRINDTLGWHPAMTGFRSLYDEGQLAIVQGVTYPNPDRSHFRGTDIWLTATDADVFGSTGWVGRYLHTLAPSYPAELPEHPLAVQIGNATSLALLGTGGPMGISFRDPDEFYRLVNGGGGTGQVPGSPESDTPAGREISFMRNIARSADVYANVVKQANDKSGTTSVPFPTTDIGAKLKVVSQLISGGLRSRIYLISWANNNFDTHASQTSTDDATLGVHANLLRELSDAVTSFMQEMKARGHADRVAGMTFSEFGRRVYENGSVGTDHGTAAPLFVFGKQVLGGSVHGANPDLVNLDPIGDLLMQHDYRDVYASVLLQWFGVTTTAAQQLLVRDFSKGAPALFKKATTSVDDAAAERTFVRVGPNPATDFLVVQANVDANADAWLTLSDVRGTQHRTASVETWTGVGRLDLSGLASGTYIVTLHSGRSVTHTTIQIAR
ncbi:MAG: DUF1501 domain-containing protein [Candidatus Kapabacteria bacterium]|nr:DUF1501 domain-containing protein [Candidatus Kapabacteria bacterium]